MGCRYVWMCASLDTAAMHAKLAWQNICEHARLWACVCARAWCLRDLACAKLFAWMRARLSRPYRCEGVRLVPCRHLLTPWLCSCTCARLMATMVAIPCCLPCFSPSCLERWPNGPSSLPWLFPIPFHVLPPRGTHHTILFRKGYYPQGSYKEGSLSLSTPLLLLNPSVSHSLALTLPMLPLFFITLLDAFFKTSRISQLLAYRPRFFLFLSFTPPRLSKLPIPLDPFSSFVPNFKVTYWFPSKNCITPFLKSVTTLPSPSSHYIPSIIASPISANECRSTTSFILWISNLTFFVK